MRDELTKAAVDALVVELRKRGVTEDRIHKMLPGLMKDFREAIDKSLRAAAEKAAPRQSVRSEKAEDLVKRLNEATALAHLTGAPEDWEKAKQIARQLVDMEP